MYGGPTTGSSTGCLLFHCDILLPIGSEEREGFGGGSIPVAILPSCQYMKMLHHNCIAMNMVG